MGRLLLIPLAVLALVCGAAYWSRGTVDEPADFRFINRGDVTTLDLVKMSWAQDIRVAYALWEGLYTLNPATLEPELGSAERVDVSDDKLVYTFHIRPAAGWTNGDPLEAKDFVFGWRRMLEQSGEYTYLLFYIKGAKAYHDAFGDDTGPRPDFKTVGIEALDAKTFRVTLEHPVAFLPDLCSFPPYFPQHEKSLEPFKSVDAKTGRVSYNQKFTRPPYLVTNGPYRLDLWEFKGRMRFIANEHYWDRSNVKSRIIDQIHAEGQIAYEVYQNGEVDWHGALEFTPEIAANLKSIGRTDLHVGPGFGTYFYSFNCLPTLPGGIKNPFADKRVRQAFTMAIDKRPIVENVTRMGEPISSNYIPPGAFKGYHSPPGLPYDPARARRLLADAGFPDGKGFPQITLLFNNEAQHGDIGQIVRRQWLNVLHVDVGLESVEVKSFREKLHNQQYAIARASWIGDYGDPSTFTDKYLSISENNDAKWMNADYDKLCERAAVEPDPQKRLDLLAEAEKLLCDESPIIPVYTYVNLSLYRDDVFGVVENPKNMIQFKAVGVKKRTAR